MYISATELKKILPNIETNEANELINNATEIVDIELGGSLELQTITRRMDGLGGARLVMENIVNEVVELKQKLSADERHPVTIDFINGNIIFMNEPIQKGRMNVEIKYTKGYATIPHDFKQFFLMYCKSLYEIQQATSVSNQSSKEIKTRSMDGMQMTYFSPAELSASEYGRKNQSFVIDYDKILKKYKNFNYYSC